MPNEKKIAEKMLKDTVASVNRTSDAKLSYRRIRSDIKKILANRDEAAKQAEIIAYYKTLSKELVDSIAEKRRLIWSTNRLRQQYGEGQLRHTITTATGNAKKMVMMAFKAIDPEFAKTYEVSEKQLDEIRDWEMSDIRQRTTYAEVPKCLKAWDRQCYEEEVAMYDNLFKNYTFDGNFNTQNGFYVADMHYKCELLREELSKHGRVWRWFHPQKVSTYKNYIRATEETLQRIGFQSEIHGAQAIERLKNDIYEPYRIDKDDVEAMHTALVEQYRERHTEEITLARDYFHEAKKLNGAPETSLASKMEAVVGKYGIKAESIDFGTSLDLEQAAIQYDKRRDVTTFRLGAELFFLKSFQTLYTHALETGAEIDVARMMEDARQISVLATQHYTPYYEVDKYNQAAVPGYLENLDEALLLNRLDYFSRGKNVDPEKLATIKNEAAQHMREWKADPKKLLQEDQTLAKQYTRQKEEPQKQEVKEEVKENVKENVKEEVKQANKEPAKTGANFLTAEEKKLANKFFDISFSPTAADIDAQISLINKVSKNLVANNPSIDKDAKKVFAKNQQKIVMMRNFVKGRSRDQNGVPIDPSENIKAVEETLRAELPNYRPQTVDDLARAQEDRVQIVVDLEDKTSENQKIEPPKTANVPRKTIENKQV